jgi:hypothetical protein
MQPVKQNAKSLMKDAEKELEITTILLFFKPRKIVNFSSMFKDWKILSSKSQSLKKKNSYCLKMVHRSAIRWIAIRIGSIFNSNSNKNLM